MLLNEGLSKKSIGIVVNKNATKHCDIAIVIGKLKNLTVLLIYIICKAQQKALRIPSVSPYLTETFFSSLKSNPPTTQKMTAGQIDQ